MKWLESFLYLISSSDICIDDYSTVSMDTEWYLWLQNGNGCSTVSNNLLSGDIINNNDANNNYTTA